MKIARKYVFVMMLILSSCETVFFQEKPSNHNEFIEYNESIPLIDLPFNYSSINLPKSDFGAKPPYKPRQFVKFRDNDSESICLGRLNVKGIFHLNCVMGDYGYVPIITHYDSSGKIIDSFNPFENAGFGIGYLSKEYVEITKELRINVIDSTWTTDISKDGNEEIPNTSILKVLNRKYELTNGKFDLK